MDLVVTKISSMVPVDEIKPISDKLRKWFESAYYTEKDLRDTYRELCRVLNSHFYADLHLGLVQTSTLQTGPGQAAPPGNAPLKEKSSRIS